MEALSALLPALTPGMRVAVLVVLHDLNLAARYADRLVMLEQGRLTCGTLAQAPSDSSRTTRVGDIGRWLG